jgi:hypothetical protein
VEEVVVGAQVIVMEMLLLEALAELLGLVLEMVEMVATQQTTLEVIITLMLETLQVLQTYQVEAEEVAAVVVSELMVNPEVEEMEVLALVDRLLYTLNKTLSPQVN